MFDTAFESMGAFLGFPMDQVRYILLLFLSYPIAFVFRSALHPDHTHTHIRHIFSMLIGVAMATMCFDWQVLLLLGVVGSSYLLLLTIPPHLVQIYTIVWVMGCMSVAHLYRLFTDYGGFHLDFSGPLMILVQKLSLVAFAVHDGCGGNKGPLNKDQEKNKLNSVPSLLEYLSYTLNFHTILAGPSVTMKEHLTFMDGSNIKIPDNPNQYARAKEHSKEPSPVFPVISKLLYSLVLLAMHLILRDFHIGLATDPSYNILHRIFICYFVTLHIRCRYYFIWLLVDSINNAAGLGFSGYDSLGDPQWGLATNMKVLDLELCMNLRTYSNAWNIKTSLWLRRVCYERISWHPSLCSFFLSAIWHGFYPGYYAAFFFFAFSMEMGKKMRRLLHAYFHSKGLLLLWFYHLVTFVATQFAINFGALPLVMMFANKTYLFWRFHYFIPVITVVVFFFLPVGRSQKSGKKEAKKEEGEEREKEEEEEEEEEREREKEGEPKELSTDSLLLQKKQL